MSDISKFAFEGNEYNFKDSESRSSISAINSELNQTEKKSLFVNITTDFDNGTFSDNILKYSTGNYIVKSYDGVTYAAVLADYDYYYGESTYNPNYSANVLEHHWVAVVLGFEAGQMNTSSSTLGGFKNSAMNSWLKNSCKTALQGAFGSNHLITHSLYLSKGTYDSNVFSYSDGTLKTERISGMNGFDMEWEHGIVAMLMSEEQIFGTSCFDFKGISTYDACRPLKLFQDKSYMEVLGHDFGQSNNTFNESTGYSCWLRNISRISPGTSFCSASKFGTAGSDGASNTFGRFPIVLLK